MGMDVYGKNPTSKVGQYFRRNVWGWHPLWQYVENVHPEIADLVEHGHTNDGDGLDSENSARLAELLTNDLQSGLVDKYIAERNEALASLEREACDLCNGSGVRKDEIGQKNGMPEKELPEEVAIITGRKHGWCNKCNGEGKVEHFATNYYLDRNDLEDFADFLRDCGGFEIC